MISILTKKAAPTPGTTIVAGGGTADRASLLLQQGGKVRKLGDFRVFAKYATEGSLPNTDGGSGEDGWNILHGGFRTDSQISPMDSLSVQGDLYTGHEGISTPLHLYSLQDFAVNTFAEVNFSGGFLQTSWGHRFSGHSETTLLVSYQRTARSDVLKETRGMFDVDFQHSLSVGERQQFVWGFDYRRCDSSTEPSFAVSMLEHWGMQPFAVDGGAEALQALQAARDSGSPFQLILTHMHMPTMDGFDLIAHIRKQPTLCAATIMMLTSAGHSGDAERCRQLSVAACPLKPVRKSELHEAIARVLGSGEPSGAARW